jgi:hypothetical protein
MGGGRRIVADVVADACEASTTRPKPPTKSPTAPNPALKAHNNLSSAIADAPVVDAAARDWAISR